MIAPDFDFEKWLENSSWEEFDAMDRVVDRWVSTSDVRELYALLRPRWIPRSEKPKTSGGGLVVKEFTDPFDGQRSRSVCGDHYIACDDVWMEEDECTKVVLWCEYPELPKEEA